MDVDIEPRNLELTLVSSNIGCLDVLEFEIENEPQYQTPLHFQYRDNPLCIGWNRSPVHLHVLFLFLPRGELFWCLHDGTGCGRETTGACLPDGLGRRRGGAPPSVSLHWWTAPPSLSFLSLVGRDTLLPPRPTLLLLLLIFLTGGAPPLAGG